MVSKLECEGEKAMELQLGNGETLSTGIFPQADGTYLALTLSQSKNFKTRKGAERWLENRGYRADGSRK